MASCNLESGKYVHQYSKHLVSAYLHDIQSLFPHEQNSFYIIPRLIQNIISIFYCGEYFSLVSDGIAIDKVNPGHISFDIDCSDCGTAYGSIGIVENVPNTYIWKYIINEIEEQTWAMISIGISASGKKLSPNTTFCSKNIDENAPYYALKNYGNPYRSVIRCETNQSGSLLWDDNYAPKQSEYNSSDEDEDEDPEVFKSGDEITMELNVKHKTLKYYVNGEKYGAWFEKIKFEQNAEYNMAIGFDIGVFDITLIDFEVKQRAPST